MTRSRAITGLVASVVTLLAMGVAVAQDATWKDCELGARNPNRSIAACSELLKRPPSRANAAVFHLRGQAFAAKGAFERTRSNYTESIRDNDSAIADYNEAIRLDPKNAEAYLDRGIAYYQQGNYDRAIADYSEAIKLDPKFVVAYNNRGIIYSNNGDDDRALADFNQAIQLDPKKAEWYINRGFSYSRKGDYDRAMADFNQVIQLDPKYARENGVDQIIAAFFPPPSFPALTGLLVDAANVFTPADRGRWEAKLQDFENRIGVEVVVATVSSLGGLSSEDYANRLFRFWRIKDVLLLVAVKEGQVYIKSTSDYCTRLNSANLTKIANLVVEKSSGGNFAKGTVEGVDLLLWLIEQGKDLLSRRYRTSAGLCVYRG